MNKKDVEGLSCVANPFLATETMQQTLNFSLTDKEEPIVMILNLTEYVSTQTHASYAFNSYWQKNQRNGGTCSLVLPPCLLQLIQVINIADLNSSLASCILLLRFCS